MHTNTIIHHTLAYGNVLFTRSRLPASHSVCDRCPQQSRHLSNNAPAQNGPGRNKNLPSTPARTRFAPSPTGQLHIGGLRTALFSYLLAKKTKGQFILRIEDTDQKRLVTGAEAQICDDLKWAGLQWDEGPGVGGPYGPYKQSERNHIYLQYTQQLLDTSAAYRCFCTPQSSETPDAGSSYVTSGCYQSCGTRSLEESDERASRSETYTVRLRTPTDAHKRIYQDLIHGKIQRLKRSPGTSSSSEAESGFSAAESILLKSDGTPTYHLANVVDDHLMKITHVIRGSEWMASTPLHYDLYAAFGWEPPQFAHVSLLADENKAKLSKRSSTGLVLDVRGMREQENVLPVALCNFLALLGWSNPQKDDLKDMQSLISDFDLKFTKGNTIVRTEKLWYLQKMHVAKICSEASTGISTSGHKFEEIVDQILPSASLLCSSTPHIAMFSSGLVNADAAIRAQCRRVLLVDPKAYRTPHQYVNQRNQYFFTYDRSRVPDEPDANSEERPGVRRNDLRSFTNDFIQSLQCSEAFNRLRPLTLAGQTDETANRMGESSCQSLLQSILCVSEEITKALDAAIRGRASPHIDFSQCDPLALQKQDALAIWMLASKQVRSEQEAQQVVEEHKRWKMGLLHFLREKLAYGQAGPNIGQVMALLGLDECRRRLAGQR